MKVSLAWVKELLPDLRATPAQVAERLTAAGLEVDGLESQKETLKGVIVGEVKTQGPHPDSDRLSACTVWDGEKEHSVVCGAPNVRADLKIAFAPLGTSLPNGMTIEPRQIRGVDSHGMICSEAELLLSAEHDGIMELPSRLKAGKALTDALKLKDTTFELSITPNRADVLSHFGVARELAALFGPKMPKNAVKVKESTRPAKKKINVSIDDPKGCPLYVARVVTGVKVGPSPSWVQRKLQSVGQRSISNVVDATNIVLMELGHPLHAFDLAKLTDNKIIVRRAKKKETIDLLDGSTKKLHPDDVVIADAERPVALAGVMGGANSEVGDDSVDLLIESAVFEPGSVRKTARRHALHTEASHSFERGVDVQMAEVAADRCAALIVELAGGEIHKGQVVAGKAKSNGSLIAIRPERASLLLGRETSRKEIRKSLVALGLDSKKAPAKVPAKHKKSLWFTAPSWRHDLAIEADLIEEVGRLAGYDDLPALVPPSGRRAGGLELPRDAEGDVRRTLVGLGFLENIALAFSSADDVTNWGLEIKRAVELANPLGQERSHMRMSLLPGLCHAAHLNQSHGQDNLRMFELGRSFHWTARASELPHQGRRLGVLMRGRRHPMQWGSDASLIDFFDLKGVVEQVLQNFGITAAYQHSERAEYHPRAGADLTLNGEALGSMGELHPDLAEKLGLEGSSVFVAELDVDLLEAQRSRPPRFEQIPRLPPAPRDLSFFVDREVTAATIVKTIREAATAHPLTDVEVFDVYEGKGVPEGQKSLAVSLVFRAAERTLTDEEVDAAQKDILAGLHTVGAKLRGA